MMSESSNTGKVDSNKDLYRKNIESSDVSVCVSWFWKAIAMFGSRICIGICVWKKKVWGILGPILEVHFPDLFFFYQ